MTSVCDIDITAKHGAGRNVYVIADTAVVVDDRSRVHNRILSDDDPALNSGIRHHLNAFPEDGIDGDDGSRVYYPGELVACFDEASENGLSNVIPREGAYAIGQLDLCGWPVEHRLIVAQAAKPSEPPAADLQCRIHTTEHIGASFDQGGCHDFTMATAADDDDRFSQ